MFRAADHPGDGGGGGVRGRDGVDPKAAFGRCKVPLGIIPPRFAAALALALAWGARKYGRFSWRRNPICATTYVDAMRRHLDLWAAGEDIDPETGVHHLAHLGASCAIVVDAGAFGTLVDDRDVDPGLRQLNDAAQDVMAAWAA